jgi:hypothetical protein
MMTLNKLPVGVCTELQKAFSKPSHTLLKSTNGHSNLSFPFRGRAANTLTAIKIWVEAGTNVIGNCWAANHDRNARSYTHQIKPNTPFVDPRTGAHTKITECMWLHTDL